MGVRGFRLVAAALSLAAADLSWASSTGITGVSGSPGDGFSTCSGCHSGGAQTGTPSIGGATSVAPGSATAFTVNLTSSNATAAGYNLSATAGTLAAGANSQLSGGQVTHTAKQFLSGSAASWGFTWTAPGSVTTETFYYCINRVNNDSSTTGDSPTCTSRNVTVNTSPNAVNDSPTAVLEGSSNNCITVTANDTSGTSGNESGDSITLSALGTPTQGGTVAIGGGACSSNQIRYTPPGSNFSGTETVTYTIRDSFNSASFQDTATVTLTVTDVNDAPTLNAIANPAAINEDAGQQTVNLSGIGDGSTFESQTLTVTASSSNTALIPNPTVTYTSANTTGSIAYTPVANANGSAIITVTVTDSGGTANGGDNDVSQTFTVTVNSVNDEPTLTLISDPAAINEDAAQQMVNLSGIGAGGAGTESAQTLTVTATSNNTALIPNPTVTYASANTTGSLAYTPVANANGSAVITVTVTDSGGTANGGDNAVSDTFTVNVTAQNDAPVAVNDTESVSKNSSNNAFSPLANDTDVDAGDTKTIISVGTPSAGGSVSIVGVGANNTLSYSPATNYSGAETIGYTMQDSTGAQSSATITVTVGTGVAPVANADTTTVLEDSSNNTIDVLANDTDADVGDTKEIVAVNGSSSFPVATANGSVSLSGTGANNTLRYTPSANYFGSDSFTYTVRDAGLLTAVGNVTVTVTGVNDAPTLNAIGNPAAIPEDAGQQTVNLSGIAAGTGESQTLTVTASSSNTAVIPNPTVTYTSANTTGSIAYTPVANASGTATITVTVTDNGGTANGGVNAVQRTFTASVTAVNDTPTVSDVPNQSISEDGNTGALAFTIGDVETAAGSLTVSGSSSNTTLVPNANIVIGGSGASRTVTVTPAADRNGSATITLSVGDGSATGTDTFTLTVGATNDAPVIGAIADQAATDNQLFTLVVPVTDADGESSFTFSLPTAPAGMSIDGSGTISWTPPIGTSGSFPVTVQAADGANATDTASFNVIVAAPDSDSDGMPDSFEDLYGLDKNDPADAAEDADGDGVTNLAEYQQGLNPTTDDVAPVVTVLAETVVVPATGYLTVVDAGAVSALDGLDGALTPTASLPSLALRPGRYMVTWSATDAAGNTGTAAQQIDVLPLADFGVDQPAADGNSVAVTVTLNGEPPAYPVTIPYTVGGTAGASDSNAASGTFTINAGTTATINVAITADGPGEAAETVVFTMSGATNAAVGTRDTHTITIFDANVAPAVSLAVAQGALPRLVAYQGDGPMTITADTSDPNGNPLSFNWSGSSDALGIDGATSAGASFDPATVAAGTYPVTVAVSDGQTQTTAMLVVVVVAGTSPEVDVDGDGIFDSTDSVLDEPALLEDQAGDPATATLLETESGLSLRRGRTSLAAGRTGALIATSDLVTVGVGAGGLPLGADSYDNVGGIFDFEVHGVGAGGSASVVLPLQTAIRAGSVYRKFSPTTGWHDFVTGAGNAVASARSALGQCPGPASSDYVDGLQPFADCVRLTLTDGGPNDADGASDGVIRDPGGVAFVGTTDDDTVTVSGGSFLAFWLPLALLLRLRRRAGAALALAALLATAPAQADHHVRIHYTGDVASGFDDNVNNAQKESDIRESGFASATGNVDYQRALSLYTTLLLRGSVLGEYWNSFDGLSNGKATAMARLLYRGDGDFFTPTLAGWASASVWEFDSAIRDSNEYRAGAFVMENVTTQITGRFAVGASLRESDGRVFDTSGYSASLNLDWAAAPRMVVYTGYQYYIGDVTSTASQSFWIVEAADAIEADDAFGGLDGGLFAYRLDAKAQIVTLGLNYAFSRKLSADFQGQYISTRATERIDYERMVGVVSLLARF